MAKFWGLAERVIVAASTAASAYFSYLAYWDSHAPPPVPDSIFVPPAAAPMSNLWAAIIFGGIAACFFGLIVANRYRTQPFAGGQLYLYKNPSPDNDEKKAYLILWSPKDYFHILFSDYESRADFHPPRKAKESCLTFHLLNAGPGDVRHLRVTWAIRKLDIAQRINEAQLFEGALDAVSPEVVKLFHDNVGALTRPIATRQEAILPILKNGATAEVKSPEAFTNAFAIYALSAAKKLLKTPWTPSGSSVRDAMRGWEGVAMEAR